jgi:hypothetical protein
MVARCPPTEEGLHVFVVDELDEEVEIVGMRPPHGDHHSCAHRARNVAGTRHLPRVDSGS